MQSYVINNDYHHKSKLCTIRLNCLFLTPLCIVSLHIVIQAQKSLRPRGLLQNRLFMTRNASVSLAPIHIVCLAVGRGPSTVRHA